MAAARFFGRDFGHWAMKKILYGLIALIALVVIAAFVVPMFMDWNSYKPEISERIEGLTGRQLFIDGDIEISLLPTPKLRITDARLSNLDGAQAADMARFQALDLKLVLGALLSGDVQVASLKLIDPLIEMERLADGRENWRFTPPPAEEGGAAGSGGADEEETTEVSLDSVSIRNGTLVYRDSVSGAVEYIQNLNGTLSAKSLEGPFRAEGSLEVRGITTAFQLASGRKRDDGHMPVSLKAELGDGLAQVGFEGKLSMLESGSEGSGTLRATGADLTALLQSLGMANPNALASGKFSIKSAAAFSESGLKLDELQIRLDETQATGAIAFTYNEFSNLDVALTINRFDLDRITANGIAENGAGDTGESAQNGGGGETVSGGGESPDNDYLAMLPEGLSASIDLDVQTLRYLGGVVHQAHAVLSLDEGVITVQQASALLPGGSNVVIFGQLSPGDAGPHFDGQMEIVSDDARAVISWLDLLDVGDIPGDRLRRFSLTTALYADQNGGELSAMELRIDASHLVGNANFALGARNRLNADLHLDQLNADAYLGKNGIAKPAGAGAADSAGESASATAGTLPASGTSDTAFLGALDATLKLTAGRLSYGGAVLSGVTLDGRLKDNVLTLTRLEVSDLSGARLALSGEIRDIAGEPDVNLNFDAKAETILGLMRVAGVDPSFRADSLGVISLAGNLTGSSRAVNLNARLKTRPATVSLVGSILQPFEDAALNMGLEMRAADTAELMRAADMTPPKLARRLGPLALDGGLDGSLNALNMSLSARAAGNHLQLAGNLADFSGGGRYDLAFDLANPSFGALAELLSGAPYEGQEVGAVHIKGRLAGDAMAAALSDLDLALGETRVTGAADLDLGGAVPVIGASLEAGLLDVGLFIGGARAGAEGGSPDAGAAGGSSDTALTGQGSAASGSREAAGQWSREPFDLSPLTEIEADIAVNAAAILAGGYRFDQAELKVRVSNGALEIDSLRGRIFAGLLEAQGRVANATPPQANISFKLDSMDIAEALRKAANIEAATGLASVDGRFTTEGNSEYDLVRALQGNATLSARDGTVEGVDLRALSDQLGALNDPADFLGLADAGLSEGTTRLDSLDGMIRVNNGLATTNDLEIRADGGNGTVRGTADLPSWRLDLTSTFTLTDHPKAPPVGVRLTGPIDNPARELLIAEMQNFLIGKIAKTTVQKLVLPKLRKGAKAEPGSIEDTLLRGIFGDPDEDTPSTSQPPPPAENFAPDLAPQQGGSEAPPLAGQESSTLAPQQGGDTLESAPEPALAPQPVPAPAPAPAPVPKRAEDDPLSPQDILRGVLDVLGN